MKLPEKIQTFFKNQGNTGFFGDRFILLTSVAGIVINAGLWWYLRAYLDPKESFLTLHFTVASGVDLVGKAGDIYNLPYYAAIFSFLNVLVARFTYRYDAFSAYILIGVLPVFNSIVFLNGFLLVAVNQ